MSIFSKLRGTIETIFQIGLGGPNLKNNAGVIEARNAADAAFAVGRGADPVGPNDWVTLESLATVSVNTINTGNLGGTKLVSVNAADGTVASVFSVGALFELVKTPSVALIARIDGITVVQSTFNPAWVWVRLVTSNPVERFIANPPTFVDSVAGNDDNDGLTAPTALKTQEEQSRRLQAPCLSTGCLQPGQWACADGVTTVASGYASDADGKGSRAGLALQNFTIPAGGTLVTIAGDVTLQFEEGQPSVRVTPTAPAPGPTLSGLIASPPVFALGNTTFNLAAPIDGTTTGGTIVQSDSTVPVLLNGAIPAGGTLVTIAGDQTALFAVGRMVQIRTLTPVQVPGIRKVVASPPIFGGVNTTFNLDSPIDGTTTAIEIGTSVGNGLAAHAEGLSTVAEGLASHSEGRQTLAIGRAAHAEGTNSIAVADGSHAEGWFDPQFYPSGPVAYGAGAHAEGEFCIAGAADSHAEGLNTFAGGFAAHSEGQEGWASGDGSHTEGTKCLAGNRPRTFAVAAGGTAITVPGGDFTAEFVNGQRHEFFPQTPAVAPKAFIKQTSASVFAAGNTTFNIQVPIDEMTTGGLAVNTLIGVAGHAEGNSTKASGQQSHAEGLNTIASGASSHAEGHGVSTASGDGAHVEGFGGSTATNDGSHAEGYQTHATGQVAHSEGYDTVASGFSSHAEGAHNTASGVDSHCEGVFNTASGTAAHCEGQSCVASGDNSHAQGNGANALRACDSAEAGGVFSVLGDAQTRRSVVKGTTPGAAPGEAVALVSDGAASNLLEPSKAYFVTVRLIATKMGLGAAARQTGSFFISFIASCRSGGTVDITAVTPVIASIVQGAAFVGATLVPTSAGAQDLTLTFTIAGGLTIQSQVVALVEYVEVLGT